MRLAATNTGTARTSSQLHLGVSSYRGIASSIRRSSAHVESRSGTINTHRREEKGREEKRHGSRRSFRFSKLTELVPSNEHIFIYRVLCIGEIFRETEHEMSLTWKHHEPALPLSSLSSSSTPRPLIIARSAPRRKRARPYPSLLLERYFKYPRYADS